MSDALANWYRLNGELEVAKRADPGGQGIAVQEARAREREARTFLTLIEIYQAQSISKEA